MTDWIDVRKQMPEVGQNVIVWSATFDFLGPTIGATAEYSGGPFWSLVDDDWQDDKRHVTHWMPLPKPPAGKWDGEPRPIHTVVVLGKIR